MAAPISGTKRTMADAIGSPTKSKDKSIKEKVAGDSIIGNVSSNSVDHHDVDPLNSSLSGYIERDNSTFSASPHSPKRVLIPKSISNDALSLCSTSSAASRGNASANEKIFNDPVHQNIKISGLCLRILDTPEYQRLAKLKQLGTCFFVFRGATHTRLEHSVGVSYLAEKVVRTLQSNQPELGITETDVTCVRVAGLCHDLGHGPFSHVFDGVFIKEMFPKGLDGKGKKWRHEDGSVMMLRHLIASNNIDIADYGMDETDMLFIEEIIGGAKDHERRGRPLNKHFLYDIVNNTRSGLDVDKLDYYQRDMKYTNVLLNANFERFIQLGRVYPATSVGAKGLSADEYPLTICYPEKLVREAVDLFNVRFRMHHYVYTHKSVKEVELMITDALILANPYIRIPGQVTEGFPDGLYKISECIFDMTAFSRLHDGIVDVIMMDQNPALRPAQDLIRKVEQRKLYVCLGKSSYRRGEKADSMSEDEIRQEVIQISHALQTEAAQWIGSSQNSLQSGGANSFLGFYEEEDDFLFSQGDVLTNAHSNSFKSLTSSQGDSIILEDQDIIAEKMHVHYGMKDKNPVARMRFYPKKSKSSEQASFRLAAGLDAKGVLTASQRENTLSAMSGGLIGKEVPECNYETSLPRAFEDHAVRLFCRNPAKESLARRCFEIWCKKMRTHSPFPSLSQSSFSHSQDSNAPFSPGY